MAEQHHEALDQWEPSLDIPRPMRVENTAWLVHTGTFSSWDTESSGTVSASLDHFLRGHPAQQTQSNSQGLNKGKKRGFSLLVENFHKKIFAYLKTIKPHWRSSIIEKVQNLTRIYFKPSKLFKACFMQVLSTESWDFILGTISNFSWPGFAPKMILLGRLDVSNA